jgi:hypothetical protein
MSTDLAYVAMAEGRQLDMATVAFYMQRPLRQ